MSTFPSKGVMIPRRVKYLSESELPHDFSSTPNGTIYSTTPGGTRIIYERDMLMNLRESPMSKTPPKNLPYIPGITKETEYNKNNKLLNEINNNIKSKPCENIPEICDDNEFQMEL